MVKRRQATISAIETGSSESLAPTLVLLVAALDEPLSYFFPPDIRSRIELGALKPDEAALLIQLRKIVLTKVKSLADSDVEAYREEYGTEVQRAKKIRQKRSLQ